MKEQLKTYARYLLAAIPGIVILLCFIPGILQVYTEDGLGYYMVFSAIPHDILSSAMSLVLIASIYLLINGIVCIRNDSNKLLKALMVFSLAALGCALLPLFAMLRIPGMLPWPYAIIPVLYAVQSVVAIVLVATDENY